MALHFIGDSLIEYFDWQRCFPAFKVVNSGLAGETVSELLRRTASLISLVPEPDWLIIMIGTNNVAMQDFSFMPEYEKIITHFQSSFPTANLLIHGLFPIELPWLNNNTIISINEMIGSLARDKRVGYLNGCQIFTKNDKNVHYFLEDGVHISNDGYSQWTNAIKCYISSHSTDNEPKTR